MVGTWTYAKADFPLWVKWVVREDGTMDAYESHPIDDNWGKPQDLPLGNTQRQVR